MNVYPGTETTSMSKYFYTPAEEVSWKIVTHSNYWKIWI